MVYFSKKCEKKTLLVDCYGRGADQRHVRFEKQRIIKRKTRRVAGLPELKYKPKH